MSVKKLFLSFVLLLCIITVLRHLRATSTTYSSEEKLLVQNYYESLATKTLQIIESFGFKNNAGTKPFNCTTGIPCVYEEEVDLRLIVITYNRMVSVMKLLNSLQNLELDGDKAILEIWVDRNNKGQIHNETFEAVSKFKWKKGQTRVHVQTSHAGILGQWIDTWRPKNAPPYQKNLKAIESVPFNANDYHEIVLILEDDLNVSSQAYRWLKAAHRKYVDYKDYAGTSLWSDFVVAHNTMKRLKVAKNQSAFMYTCLGTWGFSPQPKLWAEFQDWYHETRSSPNASKFHPYVEGALPTSWYKQFEASGTQDGMWEMWFIYFADMKKAFTVFNNLGEMNGNAKSCLSINRREVGLHNSHKGNENACQLLET